MAIKKLLIANRGEIAVRIIRAARERGIETVQVHSIADADSLPVKLADSAVEIGPPQVAKSYLNMDAILDAAAQSGADAVHPGYGFFSENAGFAARVTEAGLTFVGPSADTIRMMGDKVAARQAAKQAGVPTVPGSDGGVENIEEALAVVADTGYPVMIKAGAGGGGRGIRIAHDREDLERLFPQARAEAQSAFGDGSLYLEKVIQRARHVEVQILGDGENVIHCYERECSLQRRRQKLWEEGPCPVLDPDTRAELCDAAVRLAKTVNYSGAGTVEFLYDDVSGAFYFIEMNTRIQVEHPVTEWITGIDLVGEMLAISGGEPLRFTQDDVRLRGHAIEVRLNAEDPDKDFMPMPGTVDDLMVPGGPGVRFDTFLYSGCTITPFYDSLVGKLIVWGETREKAIDRLRGALHDIRIEGLKTTAPFLHRLAGQADVRAGAVHTRWLEEWLESERSTGSR